MFSDVPEHQPEAHRSDDGWIVSVALWAPAGDYASCLHWLLHMQEQRDHEREMCRYGPAHLPIC